MFNKRKQLRKRAAAGFAWMAGSLLFLYAYWAVMTNFVVRDFWDPSFAFKAELLHARIKQYPGHPVIVLLGSSRVDDGVRPGVAADRLKTDPKAPIVFNVGFGAAGLYREYTCLTRLIADGMKPQCVGVEILSPLLARNFETFADLPNMIVRARRSEIGDLCTYGDKPAVTRSVWLQSRLNPFYKYGMVIPHQTLAWRLAPLPFMKKMEPEIYDPWGWYLGPAGPPPPAVYAQETTAAKAQYSKVFEQKFEVYPKCDESLRRIIELCRREGITVFLFRMPESDDFRTIYTPQAEEVINSYLANIGNEYHVPLIDGRLWLPGWENYEDGHHLNGAGAETFTRRFIAEVLKLNTDSEK